MESICKEGLLAGSRQYVHLSQDEQTAFTVGQRHGKPVVLEIKAYHDTSRLYVLSG